MTNARAGLQQPRPSTTAPGVPRGAPIRCDDPPGARRGAVGERRGRLAGESLAHRSEDARSDHDPRVHCPMWMFMIDPCCHVARWRDPHLSSFRVRDAATRPHGCTLTFGHFICLFLFCCSVLFCFVSCLYVSLFYFVFCLFSSFVRFLAPFAHHDFFTFAMVRLSSLPIVRST